MDPDGVSAEGHRNVGRVLEAAAELGLEVAIRRFPEGTRTAEDAAAAIGVEVGQIVKSLAFRVTGGPGGAEIVMALVSGANRLDEQALATAAGATGAGRADADAVRDATGFPIGGVPPFGHARPLRVFVDEDLLDHAEVWAAAGTPHDVFAVAPATLARAVGATVAAIARR